MEKKPEDTLEGYVESVIFRNEENGYTVFEISVMEESLTCVGTFPEILTGQYVRVSGNFTRHPIYGKQFLAEHITVKEPHSREAFVRFMSGGVVPGIRKKNAIKIADKFGDDAYRIMLEEPENLAKEIKGISLNQAYEFQRILIENAQLNEAVMYLTGLGIGAVLAKKIYAFYKNGIYDIIKENPYRLAEDIKSIGFKTADDIAKKSGLHIDASNRSRAAIIYILERAAEDGHTYLPKDMLQEKTQELLGEKHPDFNMLITDLAADGKINARVNENSEVLVYLPSYRHMEQNVAVRLMDIHSARSFVKGGKDKSKVIDKLIKENEIAKGIELDEKQKEAVECAMRGGVLVITGGPGTGKTTVVNAIIKLLSGEGLSIKLAAPTGRASKRMSQACGMEAQTLHRLLGYAPYYDDNDTDKGTMKFEYNSENRLDTDFIIVDEMSMTDLWLMNALLNATADGTGLILVGDADQLPSVGAGNVLGDIMASECFPVVKLEKIFRQAAQSDIVSNAHRINKGESIDIEAKSKDFLFIKRDDPDRIISAMYTLISEKLPDYVGTESNQIQILTPSRTSKVGVERLNRIMQQLINPKCDGKNEKNYKGTIYREGDKVMQIKNDYELKWHRRTEGGLREEGTGIYNGDTGIIEKINMFAETLTVLFDDEKSVEYNFEMLDGLDLAYAITIHKSQGSEYPAVIMPMYPAPKMLMNRKLLYTAVTRAKRCVCMVGMPDSFMQMAQNIYDQKRYSSLADELREIKKYE